jgi:hypothetical protein
MEELLQKFQEYMLNVSPKLAQKISDYLAKFKLNQTHDFDEIEHDIKLIISNFLRNCNKSDFDQISNNLYNNFIDYDDIKLIKTIKYLIRIYSKYEDMNLKWYLYRWRIFCRKVLAGSQNDFNKINTIQGNTIGMSGDTMNLQSLSSYRGGGGGVNSPIQSTYRFTSPRINSAMSNNMPSSSNNQYASIDEFVGSDKILFRESSNRSDIFDRLYSHSIKKHDEKILNAELKRLNELETCTFQPNVYKRK